MLQLRKCDNLLIGGFFLTPKSRITTDPINDNLHPLKKVYDWKASDTCLESANAKYTLMNSTFQEITINLEVSFDNKQLSKLSEILSLIIKAYEDELR